MYSKKRRLNICIYMYANNLSNTNKISMLIFLKTEVDKPDLNHSNITFTDSIPRILLIFAS